MKIIFIGVHNKKGLKPLDSSTQSGKKIDSVIKNFPGVKTLKTNLFDVDYMPRPVEAEHLKYEFFDRVPILSDDIIVCLGSKVWEHLKDDFIGYKVVKYYHPSPLNGATRGKDYIGELTTLIEGLITQN